MSRESEHLLQRDMLRASVDSGDPTVGLSLMLLVLDDTLLRQARALETIASELHHHHRGIKRVATELDAEVTLTPKERPIMPPIAPLTIDTNHNASYAVVPRDATGAQVPATLSWSSSDTTVLSLAVSADTLSCIATTLKPGSATVTVTDGTLSASQDVSVTAAPPASLELTETTINK